jgi:hypothetical protein
MDVKNFKNRRLMGEVFKLDESTYKNLLSMAKSVDKENHVVVKNLIESSDLQANLPYILMLCKEAGHKNLNLDSDTVSKLKEITGLDYNSVLTWNSMYDVLHKNVNVDPIAMGFFINRFSEELGRQLETAGFTFMEKYQLTLIPKGK